MPAKEPQRQAGAPIWGIFLLFLGGVLLMQTLGILSWDLWRTLWRFWPVLIIIAGLGILLRSRNAWLVSLLVVALLGISLGLAIWQNQPPLPSGTTTKSLSQPLDTLERAYIEID